MAAHVVQMQFHGSCLHKAPVRKLFTRLPNVQRVTLLSARLSVSPQLRSRHCRRLVRAQEGSSESDTEATVASSGEASESEAQKPDIQAQLSDAKEQVKAGTVDVEFMGSFLADVEAEFKTLKDGVTAAESKAAQLEPQVSKLNDQLLRLTADFDNFRKRTAAEKDAVISNTKADLVTQLLPVIDNFELARSQLKCETEGEKKVEASYQSLYRQLVDVFRGIGLEAVAGEGHPFDPEVHEAIMREPSADVPDGTILQEFRKGFKLKDKLLRPAMVKVSFDDGSNNGSHTEEQPAQATEQAAAAEA